MNEQALSQKTLAERNLALRAIIRPLRTAKYEVDCGWTYIDRMLEGFRQDWEGLDLNPDYQRGHVWTTEQQQHFIENMLRGVVASSGIVVQFNCPHWDSRDVDTDLPRGVQCIDGLQRITAVQKFLAGDVRPFGFTVDDLDGTEFSTKGAHAQRFRVAVHNFARRADLLQHYLDLNAGGTPHSDEEIRRVRLLLANAKR